jgi:hypothetical protein
MTRSEFETPVRTDKDKAVRALVRTEAERNEGNWETAPATRSSWRRRTASASSGSDRGEGGKGVEAGTGLSVPKGDFRRLGQEDNTWEADFQPVPKPMTES